MAGERDEGAFFLVQFLGKHDTPGTPSLPFNHTKRVSMKKDAPVTVIHRLVRATEVD